MERGPGSERVVAASPESVPGWILTGGVDVHGRCVALAGRGALPEGTKSGQEVTVGVPLLRATVNHRLVAEGLAYPTFYSNLYEDLRRELSDVARQARETGRGLWPDEREHHRREGHRTLLAHRRRGDRPQALPAALRLPRARLALPRAFRAFLAGAADTYRILSSDTPRAKVRGLHHVVEVTGDHTVRMTVPIEDLVFTEA
ncbi:hypothetical protein [Actinacidiphila glaucinigra]|uniref:hypothetical protein n=1 Tax=Actinacidiphila glaucinigra TaxID=235986 RepID=UPI0037FE007C